MYIKFVYIYKIIYIDAHEKHFIVYYISIIMLIKFQYVCMFVYMKSTQRHNR